MWSERKERAPGRVVLVGAEVRPMRLTQRVKQFHRRRPKAAAERLVQYKQEPKALQYMYTFIVKVILHHTTIRPDSTGPTLAQMSTN